MARQRLMEKMELKTVLGVAAAIALPLMTWWMAVKAIRWVQHGKYGNDAVLSRQTSQVSLESAYPREGKTATQVSAESVSPPRDRTAIQVSAKSASPRQGGMTIDLGDGVKMDMAWIPPGEFMMGSAAGEADRQSDEGPQHKVRITKGFWMGKYEVTQEQWEKVMGSNPSYFKGAKNPVEWVSWNDCQEFIARLNARISDRKISDFKCALPTEAQWEYGCRAEIETPFHYGNSLDSSRANFYPYGKEGKGEWRAMTIPVGTFKPNAWDLHDMHGNVWEWCKDWYDGDYYAKSFEFAPKGPTSGAGRVLRGGSWLSRAGYCRSARRRGRDPASRYYDIGFRIVVLPRP